MTKIKCFQVTRRFGNQSVLDCVDLSIGDGDRLGVVGPSGVGKTTLLRILAGLDKCDSGSVSYQNDESTSPAPPNIGMVFQNLGLWPHLSARQHLEFVLHAKPKQQRRELAEAMLADVRLPRTSWERRPAALSGGEAQRLALARALVVEPEILMMDEPLAHLDTVYRYEMLSLVEQLVSDRKTSLVYVTHTWSEVAKLCEKVAVLLHGKLEQYGDILDVFWNPCNSAVARQTGPVVEIPRSCVERQMIDFTNHNTSANNGEVILVRPQQIRLIPPTEQNRWTVEATRPVNEGWSTVVTSHDTKLELPTPQAMEGITGIAVVTGSTGTRNEVL